MQAYAREDLAMHMKPTVWQAFAVLIWSTSLPLVGLSEAAILYVSTDGANTPPYSSPADAATNIQEAIDYASSGDTIIVAPGVYETGGRVFYGSMTNRVVIDKPVTVISESGPEMTHIVGYTPTNSPYDRAIRGLYLANGAILSGFTIRDGSTRRNGDSLRERSGGGIFSEPNGVVTNCVIVNNYADDDGGGIRGGIVRDSVLVNNRSRKGGGASSSHVFSSSIISNTASYGGGLDGGIAVMTLFEGNEAVYGGGAFDATLTHCTLQENRASTHGGGSQDVRATSCRYINNIATQRGGADYSSHLSNCLIVGNEAESGGGVYSTSITNCTVVGNTALTSGGGVYGGSVYSSIVTDNFANSSGMNYAGNPRFEFSCTTPLPSGSGNITNSPLYDSATYALLVSSPCIDAGEDYGIDDDLAGTPRPLDGLNDGIARTDMGAFEYFNALSDSDADGLTDDDEVNIYRSDPTSNDTDGDGMEDGWELENGQSLLSVDPPALSPTLVDAADGASAVAVSITWEPVQQFTEYQVWRSANAMTSAAIEVGRVTNGTSYTDTTAIPLRDYSYWIRTANSAGIGPFAGSDTGHLLKPPGNVTASQGERTDWIEISWDPAAGATYYRVTVNNVNERDNPLSSWTTSSENSIYYTHVPTNVFYVWVESANSTGFSPPSEAAEGYVRLDEPNNVRASDGTRLNSIEVTWNEEEGATGYDVFRGASADTNAVVLVVTNVAGDSYTDTSAPGDQELYYWVKARNALSTSGLSSPNTGFWIKPVTNVQASAGEYADRVQVTWDGAYGASYYDIWNSYTDDIETATRIATAIWGAGTTYWHNTSDATQPQYYWVTVGSSRTSDFSQSAAGYARVASPSSLQASEGTGDDAISLQWSHGGDASGYKVWRSEQTQFEGAELIASTELRTYRDSSTFIGRLYYYWVTATNTLSESEPSPLRSGYWLQAPSNLQATDGVYEDRIELSWENPAGVNQVDIYRSDTASGSYQYVVARNYVGTNYTFTLARTP
jgi:hypothetical protein